MKRLAITLALLATFVLPLSAANQWTRISERVAKSVARLVVTILPEDSPVAVTGECTAFSINQSKHTYLTAAHCFGNVSMALNGKPAVALFQDDVADIMVLSVPGLNQRALLPALRVDMGQDVAAYGYAYGWETLFIKVGVVVQPNARNAMFGNRPLTFFSFAFIGGMSGGPVVDSAGRVVSVTQQANRDGQAGTGIALAPLMAAVGSYWEGTLVDRSEDLIETPTRAPECAPVHVDERGRCVQF